MKKFKSLSILLIMVMTACIALSGCGGSSGGEGASSDSAKITIVQQYGMAYAPFQIMEQQQLVEKAYEEATGKTVEVEYAQLVGLRKAFQDSKFNQFLNDGLRAFGTLPEVVQ